MSDAWLSRVRTLTLQMVRAPSVTTTPDEQKFAAHLHTMLAAHPYFRRYPAQVWTETAGEDPLQRHNVWAFVRGAGTATVVLAGHYDVVSIANYGSLAPWAFDPLELLPRLIDSLAVTADREADWLALADLRSGNYLPGRGVLDMKSGLAAGIAVLQRFAEADDRVGNLLFLATADEEVTSEGMRAAALRLPQLVQELEIECVAAINLDAMADRGDGRDGQAVFLGSVGKLLPSVYIVGREAHAGYPFDGINPNRLAAEVTRRLDGNVALCDQAEGEWAPPPVNLSQSDGKDYYDVTTPGTAWCTYNMLSYGRGPSQVLSVIQREVQAALVEAVQQHQTHAARFHALTGRDPVQIGDPLVLTFAELRDRALREGGSLAEAGLTDLTAQLLNDTRINLPQYSRRVTELLWRWSGLAGPAAVICFASLYYPRVHVDHHTPTHVRLRSVIGEQVAAVSEASGMNIRLRPFFPAISDMSFLGGADTGADLAVVEQNTPAWGTRIRFDYQRSQALNLPTVNIGPWGRDYHQRTERVYMPYSFSVVPELIWRIVGEMVQ